MKLALQIKLQLENVEEVAAEGEDFRWFLKLKCTNCGELSNWIYVTEQEVVPLKGGRGKANLTMKCKICSRDNSVEILKEHISAYTVDDAGAFKTIVAFECRGVEVVDFDPRTGFTVYGEGKRTKFQNVGLTEKEWFDYDEENNQPVSITEVTHQFVRK